MIRRCLKYFLIFSAVFLAVFFVHQTAQAAISNAAIAGNSAADLVVGAMDADYNVSFNTNTTNTATTITITFPTGYVITNGVIGTSATAICNTDCTVNGKITVGSSDVAVTSVTGSSSARTLVIALSSATNLSVGLSSFRLLSGIQNPTTAGITQSFSVKSNATGESTATIAGVTLSPGPVTQLAFISNPSQNMVVYGGVGSVNNLAYSYDSLNWTGLGKSIFALNSRGGATWNGTMWVGVGGDGPNTLAYSYDGINWVGLGNTIFSGRARAAAWNGSMWVAGGNGTVNTLAYSYDGINWIGLGNSVFSVSAIALAWNGGMWVAIGDGASNTIAYSYDGINWTGLGTTIFSTHGSGIIWNGEMFVAAGGQGAPNSLAYSYDGINWTGVSSSTSITSWSTSVAWNGHMWMASGAAATGSLNSLAYSYDGINWTGLGNTVFPVNGRGVTWNGSRWLAGGDGNDTLAYSYDGFHWTGLGKTVFSSGAYRGNSNHLAPQGDIKSGAVFIHQPVVAAEDQYGNINPAYSGTVTITKASGAGALSGSTTKDFSAGIADFAGHGLKYDATADQESVTFTASDGVLSVTTLPIIADVVASKLVFTAQPGNATTNNPLITQPALAAEDEQGLIDTDFNEAVSLSVGTGSGSLVNNLATAHSGIINFSDLIYNPGHEAETFSLKADSVLRSNSEYQWGASLPSANSTTAIGNPDVVPPVLTIIGDNPASISQGSSYNDPGALAIDNVSGNITNSVTLTSNLDSSTPGNYQIVYSVADAAGNRATITRTINVYPSGGAVSYSIPSCANVSYGDYNDSCFGGYQYRNIIIRTPNDCNPTAEQIEATKRLCVVKSDIEAPATSAVADDNSPVKPIVSAAPVSSVTYSPALAKRLSGRILLKVEDKGQAYYINPVDKARYSLGTPEQAFSLMRELALGISNKTFSSFKNNIAPSRLAGRILIKPEDSGKAYYVNPVDSKVYYLGRPQDAFNVMRTLGLGIKNSDLYSIKEGK